MNQSWNRCCNLLFLKNEATTDEVILKFEKELNKKVLAMKKRRGK